MPDTHLDPRVGRSRTQLTDALLMLLRTRDACDISVSSLCAEAGVSRPTFYQHFASLDEVAVAGIDARFARINDELADGDGPDRSYRLLVRFLQELDDSRPTWQRTIGSGTAFSASRDAVEAWLVGQLTQRSPGADAAAVRFAAAGFLGVLRAWLLEEDGPQRPSVSALAGRLIEVSGRVLSPSDDPTSAP